LENNMSASSAVTGYANLPADAVGEIVSYTHDCGVMPRVCKAWKAAATAHWNSPEMRRLLELPEDVVPIEYLRECGVLTLEKALEQMGAEVANQPLDETRDYDIRMPLDRDCGITVRMRGGLSQDLTLPRVWVVVNRRRVPRQDHLYTRQEETEGLIERIDAIRAAGRLSGLPAEEKQQLRAAWAERRLLNALGNTVTLALPPVCIIRPESLDRIRSLRTIRDPGFVDPLPRSIPTNVLVAGLAAHMTVENCAKLMAELNLVISDINKQYEAQILSSLESIVTAREQLRDAVAAAEELFAPAAEPQPEQEEDPVEPLVIPLEERLAFQAAMRGAGRRQAVHLDLILVSAIFAAAAATFFEYLQHRF
jgi:hypothetical protein